MRKFIILILLLTSLKLSAQTERTLTPVNWKKIEAEAKDNPQHIKTLMGYFMKVDADTALTADERILAFYGSTYLGKGVLEAEWDMLKARREGEIDKVAVMADKVLAINPLNTNAIISKLSYYRQVATTDPDKAWMTTDSLKVYAVRLQRILETISMTGDGSRKHPFSVTSVGDEYNFVNYFLSISKINRQMVVDTCDRLVLGETSQKYSAPDIYFDITRVLEIEREMFK